MKQYTHAWLAFKAIERLEKSGHSEVNQKYVDKLVAWFKHYRDDVIQGAWYPDAVIKDMASSHVLKFTPVPGTCEFRKLPTSHLMFSLGQESDLFGKGFSIDKNTNLPDRCEALAHALIDNLKMQKREVKGSPVTPTNNHIAVLMFMLSHYIADAHVPFHCDSRSFSAGANIHGRAEGAWDKEVKKYYEIDRKKERFVYNPAGFPLFKDHPSYAASILNKVELELTGRKFQIGWGEGNNNTWDFMATVCQYSYLLSHELIPPGFDENTVTKENWNSLQNQKINFEQYSVAALSDAIDSIARVWLRVWRKYLKWAL
ncbi:MAG: hypothetical protein BA870_05770 [Desulfuromonadales bacterium C00003094]|jgi:hypothetical protein|nr:MAG: hypothetical protein BA870_05770 [Desulfuromonadales bacterium C00003094]OEU72592.1 MAG: hypothetical protein BA869_10995 [Desulfuromonadales bacterium C00003107]